MTSAAEGIIFSDFAKKCKMFTLKWTCTSNND